jgi:hypothetical protein
VLKNRKTDTIYLVVLFTLYLKEDVNEDGSIKEGVVGGKPIEGRAVGVEDHDDGHGHDEHANGHVVSGGETAKPSTQETSADDVD